MNLLKTFSGKCLCSYVFIFLVFIYSSFSSAQDHRNYISFSTAVFDILQDDFTSFESRLEYKFHDVAWVVRPFCGVMLNTGGAVNIYSGVYYEIPLTTILSVVPSFAPGIYLKGNSKDLHFLLEFRSQIEFFLTLDNFVKVGLSFNHISNASLGRLNPGVESIALTYYFPF